MECYYSSNPELVGCIETIHIIWKEKGMFDVKEQGLFNKKWQIVTKMWFSDLELNEIKKKSMNVTEESDKNGCEGSAGFSEEDNAVCENEFHFVLEDTCVNQDQYINNVNFEVINKLALKNGTDLKEDENEIFEQLVMFLYTKEKEQLKSLQEIPKGMMKCTVKKVFCFLKKIDIWNLTGLNNTMYAVATYVFERVGANKLSKTKKSLGGIVS